MKRHGDWMQTYSGKVFWPLDPRPEDVDIVDIAHALSMQCRYGGHCQRFYSVAEHSCLVSGALSTEHALSGLMHDASEAYLQDIIRPVKGWLAGYGEIENKLMECIAARYNFTWPMPIAVKDTDNRILLNEQAALMPNPPMAWNVPCKPLDGVVIAGWSQLEAKQRFLDMFHSLI
jgi:hypothetical protein